MLIHAFARFVVEGLGTPAPVAPPQQLVTGGLYRHVRNPMHLAVGAAIVGRAALLGQPVLLLYAAGVTVVVVAFVRYFGEPTLARTFGAEYDTRSTVPTFRPGRRGCAALRWLPAGPSSAAAKDRRADGSRVIATVGRR